MPVQQRALLTTIGWLVLAVVLLSTIAVTARLGVWWGLAVFAPGMFALRFFRDPWRPGRPQPQSILAPCDGRIRSIELPTDPAGAAIRVTISNSWFGGSTLRAPIEGLVGETGDRRGFSLTSDEGDVLIVSFPCRSYFGQPRSTIGYGEKVGQGQRIAGLRAVPAVELILPAGARIAVERGERVLAGHTPVAHLSRT
jgi:hypothetical protein